MRKALGLTLEHIASMSADLVSELIMIHRTKEAYWFAQANTPKPSPEAEAAAARMQ